MPLKPHPTDPDKLVLVSKTYKLPKPWVGLTTEERDSITDEVIGWNSCVGWEYEYACAIEAKLKEKNT
jgi:hypothetical protein